MLTTKEKQARATAVGLKVRERLQAAIDSVIDRMDEDAHDDHNEPLMVGLLVGFRVWVGEMAAIEDRVLDDLKGSGSLLDRDKYEAMRHASDTMGIAVIDAIARLAEED